MAGKGWSGSPKHTATVGDGRGMGNESRPSERGPRIGPGVLGRVVRPEYDRDREGNGGAARGKPRGAYSEE
jgi:hypothetical protein